MAECRCKEKPLKYESDVDLIQMPTVAANGRLLLAIPLSTKPGILLVAVQVHRIRIMYLRQVISAASQHGSPVSSKDSLHLLSVRYLMVSFPFYFDD